MAIVLHFAVPEAALAPDQVTYDLGGRELARFWWGERPSAPSFIQFHGTVAYYYIVALLYVPFGSFSLLPKILNAFLGSRLVPLTFDIASRISGDRDVGLRAARYVAYFPSLVLWSALNLRDVWIVWLILLTGSMALRLQERLSPRWLLALIAALALLPLFRSYVFVAVAGPMVVSFIVRGRGRLARNVAIGGLLAVIAIYLDARTSSVTVDLETLQQYRGYTGFGGSAVAERADISTPITALAFLPKGIAYFLLAPFPWQIGSALQALTIPEMLFFYTLVPAIVYGSLWLVRNRLRDALMILLVAGGLTLGYSLGQGNIGTAYRYRAQVLPYYLILAAVGVEVRRGRLRAGDAATARPGTA